MRTNLSEMIDKVASSLETKGMLQEATELDVIANTLEKMADAEVQQAAKIVSDATPEQIAAAMKQLKSGVRVASEKEAANLMTALKILLMAGVIGGAAAESFKGEVHPISHKIAPTEVKKVQQMFTPEQMAALEGKAVQQKAEPVQKAEVSPAGPTKTSPNVFLDRAKQDALQESKRFQQYNPDPEIKHQKPNLNL